ncbi:MAG: hypothetical protein ACI9UQ_001954 [Candidatus Krumholzibacteriia bacterium]|jgi:hypothetical protein
MAYIAYPDPKSIPTTDQVADHDNILQIHGVHSAMIKVHYDMYRQLMYSQGPLSRKQREMIGVVVSARNACHY